MAHTGAAQQILQAAMLHHGIHLCLLQVIVFRPSWMLTVPIAVAVRPNPNNCLSEDDSTPAQVWVPKVQDRVRGDAGKGIQNWLRGDSQVSMLYAIVIQVEDPQVAGGVVRAVLCRTCTVCQE